MVITCDVTSACLLTGPDLHRKSPLLHAGQVLSCWRHNQRPRHDIYIAATAADLADPINPQPANASSIMELGFEEILRAGVTLCHFVNLQSPWPMGVGQLQGIFSKRDALVNRSRTELRH